MALRLPISGAGRFKGDVLAFTSKGIEFDLIRRTRTKRRKNETEKQYKERVDVIVFNEDEIMDAIKQRTKLIELLSITTSVIVVRIFVIAHFPRKRKWWKREVLEYKGGDILVDDEGEWSTFGDNPDMLDVISKI